MKKILTILIGLVLGVGSVFAQNTIKATSGPVLCEDGKCTANSGGRIGFLKGTSFDLNSVTTWKTSTYTESYTVNAKNTPNYIYVYADAYEGNYFECWASSYNTTNGSYSEAGYYQDNKAINLPIIGRLGLEGVDLKSNDNPIYLGATKYVKHDDFTRYAIFKPRAAYYDYAEAEVMVIDGTGKPLKDAMENLVYNGCEVEVTGCGEASGHVIGGSKSIKSFAATSSTYGGYTYTATAPQGYTFKGWYLADAIDQSVIANGVADLSESNREASTSTYTMPADRYTTTTTYKQVEADNHREKVPKLYAIFQPSFSLSRYVAANDEFAAMTVKVENGIYTYADPEVSPTAESLYQVDHAYGNNLKLSYTDDFVATFDEIQGRTVIRVNPIPTKETLSGVITFYTDIDGTIATLTLTASNTPVFVTLLPADGYTGTYTYRQNTTGATEFPVTTSEVRKQLITATDYKFNFKPTPVDASKTKFDHWIITKKDGSVEKSTTANLYKEFEGGETIQPVFIPVNRTTFIILSQPDVYYYDLQEALDAAANMQNPQDQVVTVYAPTSTTERLQYRKDGYTITKGVTFLIPGDAAYSNLMRDVTEDDFTRDENLNSTSCYCKLSVDDNTNITVKNGNISIFSGLKAFQYDNGGRIKYGQLHLGKNCNITVENGGLYAFGFITGDKSSQVIMKEGTTTYEVFNFKDARKITTTYELYNKRNTYKVFPIGQYYIQSIEVPLTLKYGATEWVSSVIYAGETMSMNLKFIGNTNDALFVLGDGTSVTKSYDPTTDRLKLKFEGSTDNSSVSTGNMNTTLGSFPLNSNEYVLPIQNNMDIEVKNTTIHVTSDIALMPSSKLIVQENARININAGASMFVYDYGAHMVHQSTCAGGYWGALNNKVLPLAYKNNNPRPGGIFYRNTLTDATIILDGEMDVNGALYTVKGKFTTTDDPEGGANITSNGGGKINVKNIGTKGETYQYHLNYSDCKGEGFHDLPLTSPNLLLRNDKTKNANNSQYTKVSEKTTYTYYQNEGVWRKDEEKLPISGIKLYDNSNKEIEQFYVTMPTPTTINGYILASLEKLTGVTYNEDASDFSIALESGNITLNSSINPTVEGDKLKIPVIYNVQNVHGSTTQTLTITSTNSAAFTCNFSAPVKAQENYTPVFSVPSTVDIYARVGETVEVAAPIQCQSDNVASLIKLVNEGTTKWTATFTHKEGFEFVLGPEGQELSGARIKYTPSDDIRRTVTLTLKATYKDEEKNVNCCGQTTLREHQVVINAYPSMIANTMEFNEVGVIIKGRTFDLLRYVNSDGDIVLLDAEDNEISSINNDILSVSANPVGGKPNFMVTTKNPGAVTVKVKQKAKGAFAEKIIEKTIVVTSNPSKLKNGICLEDEEDFKVLTSSSNNVNYANGAIIFHDASSWTVQYEGVAGNISFTPTGSGYWAVEESRGDGEEWTPTSVYWTKLPSNHIVVNLLPTSRRVKISYSDQTGQGSLTDVCVNPLTINIEETKIYVPIINEKTTSTVVEFTHGTEELSFTLSNNSNGYWTTSVEKIKKEGSSSYNLGGVLNIYYKTKVTLTANSNVTESPNSVTLTATSTDSKSVSVVVATYNFPKPLPISSTTWTPTTGDNGYLKSEYYYHYMVESSYVKWDEANQDVIFLNKGNDTEAKRQVIFGFDGMPDEVRFQSESNEWLIEESEDNTWTESPTTSNVSTKTVGETQYWYKEISQTAKYVRITYLGEALDEITLNDLVIEGFPTAVARESDQINSAEVTEIILPDANSNKTATFYIHVKNLPNMQLAMENSSGFTFKHGSNTVIFVNGIAAITGYDDILAVNKAGVIPMTVTWNAQHIVDEGYLRIQKPSANPEEPAQDLHVIHIVGKKDVVTKSDSKTGIWTGVPDGQANDRPTKQAYQLRGLNDTYDPYPYHEVNVANAFDKDGNALFNYLVIYGETTTTDGSRIIYEADGSRGSNALTPYYIYERINETSYQLKQSVENANSPTKAVLDQVSHHVGIKGENEQMYYAIQPNDNDSVSFYMTGFCPYATTGSTMHDEGVWYFRGKEGSKVNIYLEDCHIYSRNKTIDGNKLGKYDEGVVEYTIDDGVVKGSGAVLVFEHMSGETKPNVPFNVAIHTIGHNVFKSNYGAYLNVLGVGNVRAAQVSASVQVRLSHMKDSTTAYTNIDFDDKWPDVYDYSTKKISSIKRTNGFLSLQKQHNHAPSIDLGNRNTVVNFRGGQVELQNATVVSPNYKTTLAISHRSGLMGNIKDFNFSLGLGTDDVGGTVNFYDGTTTVIDLYVDAAYKDFYLIDKNANGEEITRNNKGKTEYLTTCLRTPTNTFIYGGSHCMMRACKYVTSSGGAPKDGPDGNFLGLYKYPSAPWSETVDGKTVTHKGGWTEIVGGNGRVTIPSGNLPNANYGTESITPNTNSTANDKSDDYLNFWVPDGYDNSVIIEEDKLLTAWKASMTRIEAGFMEVNAGVGGVVSVNPDERITNLLYCQLDEYIHEVISEGCSDGECVYMAPVKDPTNGMLELEEPYVYIAPSHVGDSLQHSIVSEIDYEVTNKVYYVTTAKADTWMNFTLPFDVEKVHVVEAYREEEIEDYFNSLDKEEYDRMYETLRFQAKHNADFAAFFGMAMAMGDYAATFDDIYNDYTDWGLYVDSEPVKGEEDDGESNDDTPTREYYTGDAKNYDWRGMRQLTHYDGTNFSTSNYYLYKNNGDWTKFTGTDGKERFAVQWEVVPKVAPGETLMHKGETYSLLFPYCQGCDGEIVKNPETGKWEVKVDADGYPVQKERDYWDYWSGKFIIFESTGATVNDPHEIRGSNYNEASKVGNSPWIFDNVNNLADQAVLSGNSTFHMMDLNQYTAYRGNIYEYSSVRGLEQYKSPIDEYNTTYSTIAPTNTFLLTNHSKPVRSIARDGRIVTDGDSSGNQGTTTGGNIPTVGGGHSMFITGVDGGINVAVSNPQQVFVISATGTILYSGYVNDNVDIPLPINGIYIVKGETEVQKIFY